MVEKEQEKKKDVPMTEEQKAAEFLEIYEGLCKNKGYRLTFAPKWELSDNGKFGLVIDIGVGKIVKKNGN